MTQDDEAGTIILPNDPYWLLSVKVAQGEPTPFNAQMLYAYQWRWQPFAPAETPRAQADGSP